MKVVSVFRKAKIDSALIEFLLIFKGTYFIYNHLINSVSLTYQPLILLLIDITLAWLTNECFVLQYHLSVLTFLFKMSHPPPISTLE